MTLCGEIGGRPLEAMALIGLGFRSLSMSPASIGPVKAMLLDTDARRRSTTLSIEAASEPAAARRREACDPRDACRLRRDHSVPL